MCETFEDCEAGELCDTDQLDLDDNSIGEVCECHTDVNCDLQVNLSDLLIIKSEYFRNDCGITACQADFNGDGNVNLYDLIIIKAEYFRVDCPACF